MANGFQACLSVSSTPMSHMSTQPVSFHQSWPMYCCITGATHACHTAATVFKGSWRAWDVAAVDPHLVQFLTVPFLSLASPEASCPWPPSTTSRGDKGLSQPSHPHAAVSKATVGNLGTGLGSQTEDALRARAQSWRSFPRAMKGQTVLWPNMSGLRGVHPQRPPWSTVQASLCKASLALKNG